MRMFRPRRPSPALVVSVIALIVALGGTGYAAFGVPRNSVGTRQLKNRAVTTKKIKDGAVTARKINPNGLTVPNAAHANSADTASSATNADHASTADSATSATSAVTASNALSLGGAPASAYTRSDCNSLTGQVKGFALVQASATFSSVYTTSGVEAHYNCSGGAVMAKRVSLGEYDVKFDGSPVIAGVATAELETGDVTPPADAVSLNRIGPGEFRVTIYSPAATALHDDPFVILTP